MRKGFTTLELLAVLAMGSTAAALAGPALAEARRQAHEATCSGNVHNLALAWAMFRKDFDGEWTREPCGADSVGPQAIADFGGLGYLRSADYYMCPALDTPHPRKPELIYGEADDVRQRYTGRIREMTYFDDGPRIPREPLEQRAILADGIEMVTRYGKEPANHAGPAGRAVGANMLFADMAVEWVEVERPIHGWVMDGHGLDAPGGIGYTAGVDTYPHVTGGTWRRYGFIPNPRLAAAGGEDDVDNSGTLTIDVDGRAEVVPSDVDDIYYEDCDLATYGQADPDACAWGFVAKARNARCVTEADKDERDCALAGGDLQTWRGTVGIYERHPELQGSEGWGWPDELFGDAGPPAGE